MVETNSGSRLVSKICYINSSDAVSKLMGSKVVSGD